MAVFERRKSFYYEERGRTRSDHTRRPQTIRNRVALQRVPTRCFRDGSERVCWKLTFIQIIPFRPLWLEAVELTYLASTCNGSAHHSSHLHHRLIIHLEHLLN